VVGYFWPAGLSVIAARLGRHERLPDFLFFGDSMQIELMGGLPGLARRFARMLKSAVENSNVHG
jgi:hypothetical protein